ncbi:MAG: hypothetical protein AAFZ07_25625 [Actinomycetota bacterium]
MPAKKRAAKKQAAKKQAAPKGTAEKRNAKKPATVKTTRPGPGRPSLIEVGWDPDERSWEKTSPVGKFLVAIRAGNWIQTSAAFAGLGDRTIRIWMRRGREALAEASGELTQVAPEDLPHAVLVDTTAYTESASEVELVQIMRSQARDDWRAAIALLSRRHPDRWAERALVADDAAQLAQDEWTDLITDPDVLDAAEALAESLQNAELDDT